MEIDSINMSKPQLSSQKVQKTKEEQPNDKKEIHKEKKETNQQFQELVLQNLRQKKIQEKSQLLAKLTQKQKQ